jgi:hypothetical protein
VASYPSDDSEYNHHVCDETHTWDDEKLQEVAAHLRLTASEAAERVRSAMRVEVQSIVHSMVGTEVEEDAFRRAATILQPLRTMVGLPGLPAAGMGSAVEAARAQMEQAAADLRKAAADAIATLQEGPRALFDGCEECGVALMPQERIYRLCALHRVDSLAQAVGLFDRD